MSKKCTHCGKRIGFFSSYEHDMKLYCRTCSDEAKWVWHTESYRTTNNVVVRNSDLVNLNSKSDGLTDAEALHAARTMMTENPIDASGM